MLYVFFATLFLMYTMIFVQAMYIRVKRNKTTYFIQCEPTETILDIKQKLHVLIDQPMNDQRLILMSDGQSGQLLEDQKTLADQKATVYYCIYFI